MKNYTILIIIYVLPLYIKAQNLVPNPSFEDTVSCPLFIGDIDKAVGWSSYGITPDYFNACSTTSLTVPNNPRGFQMPHFGNAFVGIVTYNFGLNDREFIGIKLSTNLIIGQKYFLKFYLNLPDLLPRFATNKFGIKLSTAPYNNINPIQTDNITNFHYDSLITDTINWIKIFGSFTADSSYSYISFGNFYDNFHTDTLSIGNPGGYGYIYLDDICLTTDSIYCEIAFTGIEDNLNESDYNIFPNPIENSIRIEFKTIGNYQVEICSIIGSRIIMETFQNKSEIQFNLAQFKSGLYLIKFYNNKRFITKKIIKI